jgi:hypothetical protein
MVYEYDNGNIVSLLWAWGSYSDNNINLSDPDYRKDMDKQDWRSTTVEVYSMGEDTNGFTKWLKKKYEDGNPAGYVAVNDIPMILKRADRRVKS